MISNLKNANNRYPIELLCSKKSFKKLILLLDLEFDFY